VSEDGSEGARDEEGQTQRGSRIGCGSKQSEGAVRSKEITEEKKGRRRVYVADARLDIPALRGAKTRGLDKVIQRGCRVAWAALHTATVGRIYNRDD
jgi:hypothetical protein